MLKLLLILLLLYPLNATAGKVHINGEFTAYFSPVEKNGQCSKRRKYKINYSGNCLKIANGHTLTKKDTYKVLACPKRIPFGTEIFYTDNNKFLGWCGDRGGAIKRNKFDIWLGIGLHDKYKEAMRYGKKTIKIYYNLK